jgi:hypothetical protein
MRGVLTRRGRAPQATPTPSQPAVAAATGAARGAAEGAAVAADAAPSKCGLLTCPRCGLRLETLTLRCPRCRADIPLGCGGNCSTCGKA